MPMRPRKGALEKNKKKENLSSSREERKAKTDFGDRRKAKATGQKKKKRKKARGRRVLLSLTVLAQRLSLRSELARDDERVVYHGVELVEDQRMGRREFIDDLGIRNIQG